jgi:hypothetical protein
MSSELACDCIVIDPCNVNVPLLYDGVRLTGIPFIVAVVLNERMLLSNALYAMKNR